MKKILLIAVLLISFNAVALAQGGNGGRNSNGNNGNGWGNNGNGNGNGNNGNGNGNGGSNNSGSSVDEISNAAQTARMSLSNAIEITFASNGSASGTNVSIPFTTVNDYANGVESDAQELKVRSNKKFSVDVQTKGESFSYDGNTNPAPTMPVKNVLAVQVSENKTGGSIGGSFSGYATLTGDAQNLIKGADRGGNQLFSVKYKATPGFAYPAGTYTVDVVYTATQE